MKPRIMYIEDKSGQLTGPARIGRVTFSKTGVTIYYQGRTFRRIKGGGFKSNYYETETGGEYWISGPHKDGADRLYGERTGVEIDADCREEYWREIARHALTREGRRAVSMPDPSLAQFAALADEYCVFIEGYRTRTADEFLTSALPILASLYAAGLALPPIPEPEDEDEAQDEEDSAAPAWLAEESSWPAEEPTLPTPDPDRLDKDEWWGLYKSMSAFLGERNYYRVVFDPYEPVTEEEVMGALADDLADIYRDLLSGCRKWSRGEQSSAHWAWRFLFEVHWGDHATSAIRSIHSLAETHGLPWPPHTSVR